MTDVVRRRSATIEDVAREAGVSRAAVSKVIRNAYGVSPAMKERVGEAIEKLNYRPKMAARAMRGATFTIGIEIPEFGNQFFTRIVQGATAALEGTGYQLIIAPAETWEHEGYRALQSLSDYQVDGIIAVSPMVSTEWLEDLAQGVPVVMLGRHDASVGYDTVTGDDVAGTEAIMQHLFDAGHTRIAHLTRGSGVTDLAGTPHRLRLEGYRTIMRERNLPEQVLFCGPSDDDALEVISSVLAGDDRPTAVFAAHDQLALGVLRAVGELELGPADVAVAGYDDIDLAGHPSVSLTTMDQDGRRMGRRAIELLLERIAGRPTAVHEVLEPKLRVRRSTGA